ncbi:MAG: polysaccharide biosynthesis/export family protein [Candidatus Latescibacterota bacterium]
MSRILILVAIFLIPFTIQADEVRFQPGDLIEITVFNSPEMNGSFRIYSDGFIRVPLAGKIPAAGKTEDELYQSVFSAVNSFVKNPHITVIPRFNVSVIGQVARPGVFNVTGSEKVIEIIAQAGGFTPEASGKVVLHRNNKTSTISKGNILKNDLALSPLAPGDVLVVEKKMFSRNDYSLVISALTAISFSLYYVGNR